MFRPRIIPALCLALTLLTGSTAHSGLFSSKKPAKNAEAQKTYDTKVKPLLDKYCIECHGEKKKGDLDLRIYKNEAAILKDRDVWEKLMQNVQKHEMPPEKKPQPKQEERDVILEFVKGEIFQCDCEHPDPGRVTIRRLNRVEYNNTIRDLVGVDFKPAQDFPADDVGYGFDNIGDVLSMPPILIEKYMKAAQKILDEALIAGDPTRIYTNRFGSDLFERTTEASTRSNEWLAVKREGEVFINMEMPWQGEYLVRMRVAGDQAGSDPVKLGFRVDGKELKSFKVPETMSAPGTIEQTIVLKKGAHKIAAAFLNKFKEGKDGDTNRVERNMLIQSIEVSGPFKPAPVVLPETHKRVFTAIPTAKTTNDCLKKVIGDFARRAYRRPIQNDELSRLVKLAGMVIQDGGTYESGVKLAMQAVLVSPHFLFRGELLPDPNNPKAIRPVTEYSLASRLSYFLWSTMPDEELMDLAAKGKLRKNLDAQVKRMLKHPRSHALVDNFAGQWLQIRNLANFAPDEELFPEWDESLRKAMEKETVSFFDYVVREDHSVLEFLDSDYSFLNERLARHYGISGVAGEEFRKVSMKGTPRGGLLTQGSILAITSNPTRTSPVKRGRWILDNILGSPPPPPPPGVPELKEGKELTGTLRQRMEQHRENTLCASCHARMDPIGFGFENFNALGEWRSKEGKSDVESGGKLTTGESFDGPEELKQVLMKSKKNDFTRALTQKLLTYGLGRGLDFYDKCAVDEIVAGLEKSQYRFSALISGVVKSTPFQMTRGDGTPTVASGK